MVVEGSDRLDIPRGVGQMRTDSAYADLAAEIAELRELLQQQEREIARLNVERDSVCCPWRAQSWHRAH